MKIKYFGHSCFKITSDNEIKIVTDPFDDSVGYKVPELHADIVTLSHNHSDHNNIDCIKGEYELINKAGNFYARDIVIKGIMSFHDNEDGKKRGNNVIFTYNVDNTKVCHLGDLGHVLTEQQVLDIGGVDVLFIPVGGYYTIDSKSAVEVVNLLNPSIVIPMHFKTPVMDFPIDNVEVFLQKIGGGEKLPSKTLDVTKEMLDGNRKVYVLRYE